MPTLFRFFLFLMRLTWFCKKNHRKLNKLWLKEWHINCKKFGKCDQWIGKKSICLKIPCQPPGTWPTCEIQFKSEKPSSSRPGVDTKEMQSYTGEKSISAVFEEILLKSSCEHSKLLKDKTKVTEGGEKPSSTRPGVEVVSKQLSDWIFVQKRPRNKLLSVWHD